MKQPLKGLAMIFAGQKTPFIIFRSKEIYYIFQNKSQNPHQFAVIMKKNGVFGKGTLAVFLNFVRF